MSLMYKAARLRGGVFTRFTGGGEETDSNESNSNSKKDLRIFRFLAGLITFALIIPMALFLGAYLNHFIALPLGISGLAETSDLSDIRVLTVSYGTVLLAILVGTAWASAYLSDLKLWHFWFLLVPFPPFIATLIRNDQDIWLISLILSSFIQVVMERFLFSSLSPDAKGLLFVRVALIILIIIAFILILLTGLFA